MRIYPTPGLVVRDPVKRDVVPESGREVPDDDVFWQRRLADGDVSLKQPEAVPVPDNVGNDDALDLPADDAGDDQ